MERIKKMGFKKWRTLALFILVLGFSLISWSQAAVPEAAAVGFISTCEELQAMKDDLSGDYCLANDIDCSMTNPADPGFNPAGVWGDGQGFEPIGVWHGKFTGSFDGRGHEIDGLYINRPSEDYVGLFSFSGGSDIKDVGLVNVDITGDDSVGTLIARPYHGTITNCYSTGNVTGDYAIGGLFAFSFGSAISDCYSTVTVNGDLYTGGLGGCIMDYNDRVTTIINSYATGDVTGGRYTAGLVGGIYNNSEITNSYTTGNVTGNDRTGGLVGFVGWGKIFGSYSTGAVNGGGGDSIGGLVGEKNSGSIVDSYATGAVNGGSLVGGLVGRNDCCSIRNSYSTGTVNGGSSVGGLVGKEECPDYAHLVYHNCYWDTQTSGQTTSAGGTGKTTAQMKQEATFQTAWDFVGDGADDIWKINENVTYPYLRWEDENPSLPLPPTGSGACGPDTTPPTLAAEAWIPDDSAGKNYIPDGGAVNLADIDEAGEYFTVYSNATEDYSTLYNHKARISTDGGGNWSVFNCNDANSDDFCDCADIAPSDGMCDENPGIAVGDFLHNDIRIGNLKSDTIGDIPWLQIHGPLADGAEVRYKSEATNTSATPFTGYSTEQSFVVEGLKSWAKVYGEEDGEDKDAYSVWQTSDGGYIMAGRVDTGSPENDNTLILKIDSSGSYDWARTFRNVSRASEEMSSIQQTSDGGYIVAGDYIFKLSADGTIVEWSRDCGCYINSIYQTSDGGYIAACASGAIIRFNGSGDLEWSKKITVLSSDVIFSSIQQTSDGGYVMMTQAYHHDFLIVKLNSDGVTIEWARAIGKSGSEERPYAVQQTDDNGDGIKDDGYIIVGGSTDWNNGHYLVLKLNGSGEKEWAKLFNGDNGDYLTSVQQTADNGYIIAGMIISEINSLILKLDSSGNYDWARIINGEDSKPDVVLSVQNTSDGGYIVAGRSQSFIAGDQIFAVKLNSGGDIEGGCYPLTDAGIINEYGAEGGDDLDLTKVQAGEWTFNFTSIADAGMVISEPALVMTSPNLPETDACIPPSDPPTVTINAPIIPDYCDDSWADIGLSWDFSDVEDGAVQTAYQIELTRSSDGFSCDSGKQISPATIVTGMDINSFPGCGTLIEYGGGTYTWQVTVWDSSGANSRPPVAGDAFTVPGHQYPSIDFECSLTGIAGTWEDCEDVIAFNPEVGDDIYFKDASNTYASGAPVACTAATCTWFWDFNDDTVEDDNVQDPTLLSGFAADGIYPVTLKATDNSGYECPVTKTITIGAAVATYPSNWSEIAPGERGE